MRKDARFVLQGSGRGTEGWSTRSVPRQGLPIGSGPAGPDGVS